MNTEYPIEMRQLEEQGIRSFGRLTKDRSASKTPIHIRKAKRRAKNKAARASRKRNQ